LSPRLGLVFNPDGKGRTTVRLGGALLYDSVGTFIPYRMVAQNPPYGPQVTNTSGPYQFSNPWSNVPGGNPFPLPPPGQNVPFPLANAEAFLPPHIHSPSVVQWNASVQHRLSDNWVLSVSYLGNSTSHLWIGNEINPAVYIPGTCAGSPCSSTGNTQARRVLTQANPNAGKYYSQMTLGDDGISANYNGLLASVEHRFAQNFTLLVTIPGRNVSASRQSPRWAPASFRTRTTFEATTDPAPTMCRTCSMPASCISAIGTARVCCRIC
jgi:hypothetical protein